MASNLPPTERLPFAIPSISCENVTRYGSIKPRGSSLILQSRCMLSSSGATYPVTYDVSCVEFTTVPASSIRLVSLLKLALAHTSAIGWRFRPNCLTITSALIIGSLLRAPPITTLPVAIPSSLISGMYATSLMYERSTPLRSTSMKLPLISRFMPPLSLRYWSVLSNAISFTSSLCSS